MVGVCVAVLMGVLGAALMYSKWRYGYWAKMGVQTPPTLPFIGNLHKVLSRNVYRWESMDKIYHSFSDQKFFGVYSFFRPMLVVRDLDIMKTIMVKDFDHFVDRRSFSAESSSIMAEMMSNKTGDEWKALRSIMTPSFSSGKMKKMFTLVVENADILVSSLLKSCTKNPSIDMKDMFGRFTMDTIASCAFGINCNSLTKDEPLFKKKAESFFTMRLSMVFKTVILLGFPRLHRLLGLKVDTTEVEFFSEVVEETIRARQSGEQPNRGDFLDLMMEARKGGNKQVLKDRTVVAQCIMFLVAGFENISSLLSYTSHLLAQNPDEQRKLRRELRDLVSQNGEVIDDLTYQDIMEAKRLDACIAETLRLYPSVFINERVCTKPYRIADTDVNLRVGDLVQFPIWSLHRDPKYWSEPNLFQPDRFMPENKSNIHNFTYMPFGMGPRNCIANRFALMEAKTALAKVILGCEFELVPGRETIDLVKSPFFFRPKDGVILHVKPAPPEWY